MISSSTNDFCSSFCCLCCLDCSKFCMESFPLLFGLHTVLHQTSSISNLSLFVYVLIINLVSKVFFVFFNHLTNVNNVECLNIFRWHGTILALCSLRALTCNKEITVDRCAIRFNCHRHCRNNHVSRCGFLSTA